MNSKKIFETAAMILIVLCICGCGEDESTAVQDMASQMVREQSAQNNRLAEATRDLVSAEAQARKEMLANQQNHRQQLQQERSQLNSRRSQLDKMRTEIELDRRRAPIIAQSIFAVGGILACLCPLLLAAYVLYSANRVSESDQQQLVNELLIGELAGKTPLLLPAPTPSVPFIEDGRSESEEPNDVPPF